MWSPKRPFRFLISFPEINLSLWLLRALSNWLYRSLLGVSESSPSSRLSQFSLANGRISRSKSKYFFLQQMLR